MTKYQYVAYIQKCLSCLLSLNAKKYDKGFEKSNFSSMYNYLMKISETTDQYIKQVEKECGFNE